MCVFFSSFFEFLISFPQMSVTDTAFFFVFPSFFAQSILLVFWIRNFFFLPFLDTTAFFLSVILKTKTNVINKWNNQFAFVFLSLWNLPTEQKRWPQKKQQQHKLEFQLGVLCFFLFSVCWQHLKVFFQNILFLETKHGRKLKRVMTFCLLSKKRTASQHCWNKKKKVNINWSSLLFFCCWQHQKSFFYSS